MLHILSIRTVYYFNQIESNTGTFTAIFHVIFKEPALLRNVGRFYPRQIKNFIYEVLRRCKNKKFSKQALHLRLHVPNKTMNKSFDISQQRSWIFISWTSDMLHYVMDLSPKGKGIFLNNRTSRSRKWFLKMWLMSFVFIFSGGFLVWLERFRHEFSITLRIYP